MRLVAPRAAPIRVSREIEAEPLWSSEVRGAGGHLPVIRPGTQSLYFTDGLGCLYATIRWRRCDLCTGKELARHKAYNTVRCTWFDPQRDEVIIAQDTRLVRLDSLTLSEIGRWDKRVPAFTQSLTVATGIALVANGIKPGVGLVDLATGGVKHRSTGPLPLVLSGHSEPLILERYDGGLFAMDAVSGDRELLLNTPPCHHAVIAEGGRALWMATGEPAKVGLSGPVKFRRHSNQVARFDLADKAPVETYELPGPVGNLYAGRNQVWFVLEHGGVIGRLAPPIDSTPFVLTLPLPVGSGPARLLRIPEHVLVVAAHPDAGLVLTSDEYGRSKSSIFTLLRIPAA